MKLKSKIIILLYYHICSDRADDGGTFQFSAYTGEGD